MHPMRCLLQEMTSCPCCPRPTLLPQSQHRGLHTGFQSPCCSWCHFLIGPRKQKTSNFPFTASQARKRKPAWMMVALTRWSAAKHVGTGKAALGRNSSSFLSRGNPSTGLKGKKKITCSDWRVLLSIPRSCHYFGSTPKRFTTHIALFSEHCSC